MSRAHLQDKSTTVSLFPFLAVLLCTMGSLLVVLVAVARLSRVQAEERASADQATQVAADEDIEDAIHDLQSAQQAQAKLAEIRAQAEEKLREEQLRLRHIEDHMRRLQEQFESLRLAAAELAGLEEEHTDDREQAAREVARLQSLIDETRESIEALRAEEASKPRSYAIVPYEGTNGTRRRPIYIECRAKEVILQPEGIQLKPEDFLPPLGPGNPLASALRAAREHIARENPAIGAGQDTEPYPLILVRPDGIAAYYRVRQAIESWDAAFGYELVDGDWELEFPPPNPQLADVEYRAVEQARARERLLAAAAPRAYGMARSGRGGGFDVGESDQGGSSSGGFGSAMGDAPGGGSVMGSDDDATGSGEYYADGFSGSERSSHGEGGSDGVGGYGQQSTTEGAEGDRYAEQATGGAAGEASQLAGQEVTVTADSEATNQAGPGGPAGQPGSQQASDGTTAEGSSPNTSQGAPGGSAASAGMASGSAAGGGGSPTPQSSSGASAQGEETPSVASFDYTFNKQQHGSLADARGSNWAVGGAGADAVPIRRSIQIVVRQDRLAILPELSASGEPVVAGKEVPLPGPTRASLDDFVKALQDTMRDWGIAGQGLYWRPVLVLNVGPDGQQRAEELTRLLHNSGIELRRASATAQHDEGGDSRATR